MRDDGFEAVRISRGNTRDLYWTLAQMVAHHTSNGCNLKAGDLIATGTISGQEKDSRGCLIERTWRGSEPFTLPTDETRTFLEDGDTVTLRVLRRTSRIRRVPRDGCRLACVVFSDSRPIFVLLIGLEKDLDQLDTVFRFVERVDEAKARSCPAAFQAPACELPHLEYREPRLSETRDRDDAHVVIELVEGEQRRVDQRL
jgi:hypothetical protein